jgi:hypothetical protein
MARQAANKPTQEEEATGWTPIQVTDRKIIGPVRGVYTIQLTLSAWPDQDWRRLFSGPPSAGDHPTVENKTIFWEVPKSDLTDAYGVIKKWIDTANEGYVKILEKRDSHRRQTEGKEAAARADLDSLQKELDSFRF